MSNLPVSYNKIFMFLFLALAFFYSCTADEDLLLEAVNHNGTEKQAPVDKESSGTSTSDSIPVNQTDTTDGTDKPSNIPIALATPSSGVVPLEVSFTVSNSSISKAFAKYEWKFKDGTKASSSKALHTFKEVGKHEVELIATDEDGQILIDSVTVTVIESEDELPVAAATASPSSGSAPLDVRFTVSDSTDDKAVTDYYWDFKDGSPSNEADPSHVFSEPGTYQVELTVTDEKDLTDKATVTITVDEPANQAPVAVAGASVLSGDAPLQVEFTGSDSSDDKGVVGYSWDFQDGSSSDQANTSHTFNDPGVYNISLTVTDGQGLQDTAALTVTVNQGSPGDTGGGNIPCSTGGGMAGDTGEKIWCWRDIAITENNNKDSNSFSSNQLATSSHCNRGMVTRSGDRLRFRVNPTYPAAQGWCSSDYNYRAEIREAPGDVRHPVGTEQWFGWNYRFGDDYKADTRFPFIFWQVHGSFRNPENPLISLWVASQNMAKKINGAGEIFVVNAAQNSGSHKYTPIGITPTAGTSLDIVVHVIWGTDANGLYEVWINGNKVYGEQERTVYAEQPEGGYTKWGIYKWDWSSSGGVQESKSQGITEINTSMGPLRIITRRPGDTDYRKDSYTRVAPD